VSLGRLSLPADDSFALALFHPSDDYFLSLGSIFSSSSSLHLTWSLLVGS